jgi:hypothetical protein
MSLHGGWVFAPTTEIPENVKLFVEANAFILGCDYEPILYLGYQVVNGTNHAVLAQQTVLNGRDTNNAIIMVVSEKPGSTELSLKNVISIVEGGGEFGGVVINITTDIPKEAQLVFDEAIAGYVGSNIEILAYLGSQVTTGTDYIFLISSKAVVAGPSPVKLAVATVNSEDKSIRIEPIFDDEDLKSYKVLRNENVGKPLGEWP